MQLARAAASSGLAVPRLKRKLRMKPKQKSQRMPATMFRQEGHACGYAGSRHQSTRLQSRLNAIAAERAETIATTIHSRVRPAGIPFAASMAPQRANVQAKTECSHLIISRVIRRLRKSATVSIVKHLQRRKSQSIFDVRSSTTRGTNRQPSSVRMSGEPL